MEQVLEEIETKDYKCFSQPITCIKCAKVVLEEDAISTAKLHVNEFDFLILEVKTKLRLSVIKPG